MNVLITGGTGFIGSRLVRELLKPEHDCDTIYLLVRPSSMEKAQLQLAKVLSPEPDTPFDDLPFRHRIKLVEGDLRQPNLGVSEEQVADLQGKVDHFFHLAAIYDLKADAEIQIATNIQGTRHAVQCATSLQVKHLHLMSSIAAAGWYPGVFREDMFDEATRLDHPYFSTKHESERVVREQQDVPWRIYRPSFVVGDSRTGEMDKVDGPYYFFKAIQSLRELLPPWLPLLGVEGGRFNIVPVDYVVKAMAHLALLPDLDGETFHLVDQNHWRFGDLINLFSKAAHAPQFQTRINARMFQFIPPAVQKTLLSTPPVNQFMDELLDSIGIPKALFGFINWPTKYDDRSARKYLDEAGIQVPELDRYAWRLWDYWERHLDPALKLNETLESQVIGKNVLITGGSSGIGKATAMALAQAGANVIICARNEEKLQAAHAEIEAQTSQKKDVQPKIHSFNCDITQESDVADMFGRIENQLGGVDFLINNAGHSIRRSVMNSLDRIHDFERTINLNYMAGVRVTLKCLPLMEKRGGGQIINISSIGVLSNAPRFSAYVASKAALEAFSRCAAAELADHDIRFTNINMPLVRTPMIAPTTLYNHVPTLSPDEAAELVLKAIIDKPERLATKLGMLAEVVHAISPRALQLIMNTAFRLFPESTTNAATGEKDKTPSPAQVMFATLMSGVHW